MIFSKSYPTVYSLYRISGYVMKLIVIHYDTWHKMKNGRNQIWDFCKHYIRYGRFWNQFHQTSWIISEECIYLPEHFKGRIEVNLCPWYWNGSMHIGSLDEAALRLTLVVLCNQRINQFKRQSQTYKTIRFNGGNAHK